MAAEAARKARLASPSVLAWHRPDPRVSRRRWCISAPLAGLSPSASGRLQIIKEFGLRRVCRSALLHVAAGHCRRHRG